VNQNDSYKRQDKVPSRRERTEFACESRGCFRRRLRWESRVEKRTGWVDKREKEIERKSEIKRIAKENRGETGEREVRGERAKWLSTAATRQRSPSSTMMDAFMNDPTEPRTSLLLPPSSFSYFIFTFLDRRKSANLWVIRPLCRVEAHTKSTKGSELIERYGELPVAHTT